MSKTKDLTGKTYGSLKVLAFDEERHRIDRQKRSNGEIKRVRRHYICECMLCGKVYSVRGENLVSGNTKGCGCDMYEKGAKKRHIQSLNKYEYDNNLDCWKGYSNNTSSVFLFDDSDYNIISKYCWHESNYGYMITRLSKNELILLHRLIMFGYDSKQHSEYMVDHINRVRLDNRRKNLRLCTAEGNARNSSVKKGTISGVLGVGWQSDTRKWRAYISENGRFKSLGNFKNKEDAIKARKEAEIRIFGEFAPQ